MSKISELSNGGALLSTDDLIVVRSGGNVRAQLSSLNGIAIGSSTPAAGSFTTGSFSGNVSFADNAKAIFGGGSDLQIYHDGSNSRIHDAGTGVLLLQTDGTGVQIKSDGSESIADFNKNGGVNLYFDNSKKLATTSTGIDVTGTLTVNNFASLSSTTLTIGGEGGANGIINSAESIYLNIDSNNNETGKVFRIGTNDTGTGGDAIAQFSDNGDISFYDGSGNAGFFWDASAAALGIGTSSINRKLEIAGNNNGGAKANYIRITDTDTSATAGNQQGGIEFFTNDVTPGISASIEVLYAGSGGGGEITFNTNSSSSGTLTEALRVDENQNFLAGTSNTTWQSQEGLRYFNGSSLILTRDSDEPLNVNRLSTKGNLVVFYKDGGTVGRIGTDGEGIYIGDSDVAIMLDGADNAVLPWNTNTNAGNDNFLDLGSSDFRWDDIYATNGTIQTSDRNEKHDIEALSDAEQRVAVAAKGLLRKFRWKSSVEEKGDDARIHFGIIAQDLQDAFTAEGLDAGRYAMFISSTWTDEETGEERTRLGVRYSELLAFIISAI